MARKKHTAEEIITKLREADVLLARGQNMVEVCRQLAISDQTYYKWRKEYGGMQIDQAKRLKQLEQAWTNPLYDTPGRALANASRCAAGTDPDLALGKHCYGGPGVGSIGGRVERGGAVQRFVPAQRQLGLFDGVAGAGAAPALAVVLPVDAGAAPGDASAWLPKIADMILPKMLIETSPSREKEEPA